jgi:hypothetical protein
MLIGHARKRLCDEGMAARLKCSVNLLVLSGGKGYVRLTAMMPIME